MEVVIKKVNGYFVANSTKYPTIRHRAATPALAKAGLLRKGVASDRRLSATQEQVEAALAGMQQNLPVPISQPARNPMAHAGIFSGEAAKAMQEICDEAYCLRDAEGEAESPE